MDAPLRMDGVLAAMNRVALTIALAAISVGLEACVTPTATCAKPQSSKEPVSLLIVTGGHEYEPREFYAAFTAMPNVRFQHLSLQGTSKVSVPEGGIGQYDVILFYDFQPGEINAEWRQLLDRGRGFVFLHHSIGDFPRSQEFKAIAGGHANFSQERVPGIPNTTYKGNVSQRFKITDPAHPVTCGVGDFEMLDEGYDNMDVDPAAHILMTSDYPKITPAAAWTWTYNGKRVLAIQPGHGSLWLPPDHGPSSYQNEPFKKLLTRGVHWAAGRL
jgi:uncharacterized protein